VEINNISWNGLSAEAERANRDIILCTGAVNRAQQIPLSDIDPVDHLRVFLYLSRLVRQP
jgi:hypothetical protein